ncbi:MAG: YncE family protein, partial [Acidimicrobiia bacterium]
MRRLLALLLVVAACAPATEPPPPRTGTSAPATSVPETTTTEPAPTTTAGPTTTVEATEATLYAVVAEERSQRLAVIDPETAQQVASFDLPARPHNLAAIGSVVYATHPSVGTISRVDVATGEVTTVAVGTEPHDVKAGIGGLWVADEDGRRVYVLDPETLKPISIYEMGDRPHDLYVDGIVGWVTLIGSDQLARIRGDVSERV